MGHKSSSAVITISKYTGKFNSALEKQRFALFAHRKYQYFSRFLRAEECFLPLEGVYTASGVYPQGKDGTPFLLLRGKTGKSLDIFPIFGILFIVWVINISSRPEYHPQALL
jgi:hypothetical protein